MNNIKHNQGARTKTYPKRYVEFAATQSVFNVAIAPEVAAVLPASFVAPSHRIASDTISSSRLDCWQNSSQRGVENISN